MSLTSNLFDKNAYRAQLLRSTDPIRYTVNEVYPARSTCRPDHLNGFHNTHAAPELVDHESDLHNLDNILSQDPWYQYPKVNNQNKHFARKDCNYFPSIQNTRLFYYYPISELDISRMDHIAFVNHPIHSSNYIGRNTREDGRFTSQYVPHH